jgi:MFS family permease
MNRRLVEAHPWAVALSGLVALAIAMGIGRFAFTPILPMMQQDSGLSVTDGGWLASANYLGYLVGALGAMRVHARPGVAVRGGLVAIAATTLAMAFHAGFPAWLVLRFAAGIASAWVLVHLSALAAGQLEHSGRADLGGVLYAGVGAGVMYAGLACLILLQARATSDQAWIVLGISALVGTVPVWLVVPAGTHAPAAARHAGGVPGLRRDLRYILCYGAFGVGYIIPATFLPVMARTAVPDPVLFGWAWPAFGAASVLSTLVAARLAQAFGARRVWAGANVVMAVGVLIPIVLPGLAGVVVAALCVGGTFMVITMLGLQEARRLAGADARRLMAAMTAAFAVGQIVGPLLVSGLVRYSSGFAYALGLAALPLLAAGAALATGHATHAADTSIRSREHP